MKHISHFIRSYLDRFLDPRNLEIKIIANLERESEEQFEITRTKEEWIVKIDSSFVGKGQDLVEAALGAIYKKNV